jgi:hypothetical protein
LAVTFLVRAFTIGTALSFRLVFLSRLVREEEPIPVPDLLSCSSAAAAALVFSVSGAASAKEMRSLLLLLLLPASTTLAAEQLLFLVLLFPWPLLVVSRSAMRVKLKKKKKNAVISQEDIVKHVVSPSCSSRLHAGMIKEVPSELTDILMALMTL